MDEVSFALEERKQVLPVLYKSCEILFRVRRLQYIDFIAGYDAGLARLLEVLKIGQPSSSATEPTKPEKQTDRGDEKPATAPAVSTKGGFHIGSVAGNAAFSAGGDMVAGDKITQTTTTTSTNNGFKQEDDKQ